MNKYLKVKKATLFLTVGLMVSIFANLNLFFTKAYAIEESIPEIGIVSLDHYPFKEGDKNKFFISSKKYNGQVKYQLFYTCKTIMGDKWKVIKNKDTDENGWTKNLNSKEVITFDISQLELKKDYYRFAIRIKRADVKGKYSNIYGDYDNAFPFAINVEKDSKINMNGNMLIDKSTYLNNQDLSINGVEGASKNLNYKLHMYDVKNNKWMLNLTEYGKNINYSLKDIKSGIYVADVWCKEDNSVLKYDGWKLKIINIDSNEEKNVIGNTGGNIANAGIVSSEDGFVYFSNYYDKGKLYKSKINEGELTKITDDFGINLNVVDGWIYYSNLSDKGKIYRIKVDGTCRQKISSDFASQLLVDGEWIYYLNLSDNNTTYKIKNNGTNRVKLNSEPASYMNISTDSIYYINGNGYINKINKNSGKITRVFNEESICLNVVDGWIYYVSQINGYKLYKMKESNLEEKIKISDNSMTSFNVYNGYIYYTNNENNSLFRLKIDGTENICISKLKTGLINIVGNYVYYQNIDNKNQFYRLKIDGTENIQFGNINN